MLSGAVAAAVCAAVWTACGEEPPFHGDGAFAAEMSADGAVVAVRGLEFRIPARGRFEMHESGRRTFILSHNIRVSGESCMVAACEDHRDDRIAFAERTAERIVVRTDRSLALHDYKRSGAKTPWDAARLVTDHVFRKGAPGVVVVARLVVLKPFGFVSWHANTGEGYVRFSVDGEPLRPYPVTAEFRKLPDGYRTRAVAYVNCETPDGRLWYLGREFANFDPVRDGRPGSFYTRSDVAASPHGRTVSAGDVITLSAAVGRIVAPGDLDLMRALRCGDGSIPVVEWKGDWSRIPVAVRRGELKDYRPVAGLGWSGPDDLSFTLKLAQDEKGVCLLADVADDIVVNGFSGKDIGLGDSVHAVFAGIDGLRTLDRTVSAADAARTPSGYAVEIAVGWDELAAAGIDRAGGVRFNLCVADQDRGTDMENWMGVADGILGGRDTRLYPVLDLAGVVTTFAPETIAVRDRGELERRMAEIQASNDALPECGDDEYTSCLKAMTEYFLDFMRSDLELDIGAKVHVSMMRNGPRTVDADYRRYILGRIGRNVDDLEVIQRELAARQGDLAAGRVKPVKTVKHDFSKRPAICDGGFKVDGRELLLLGPDTWTNSKSWQNRDAGYIARTGFNQMNVFYVGGTNRDEVARCAREAGLYCVWGSCTSGFDVTRPTNEWPRIARERLSPAANIGCLNAPADQGPNFVYQVSFPEQWSREKEKTSAWAEGFQAWLRGRFGTLDRLNEALGSDYAGWTDITFTAALGNDALKYESFVYRMQTNMRSEIPQQKWKRARYGLPTSVHFSSHYNMTGLDPLVALSDFEALWSMFDIVGFDGGFGLEDTEWAIDFAKGGFDIDFSRSVYPHKPVSNNELHVIGDGTYLEYPPRMTYFSSMLAYLLGQNASSVWNWANSRHTYGEYVFTRAYAYREMVRCALDLRCHAEEIAAFRRAPEPPFRIFHSLPSMAERDPYMRSLYGLYAALSFTGWPVRFLTERDLARGDFKGAKIIVVPDARRVSDATFAAIAGFRREGGTVLADGDGALAKDQWGRPVPARNADSARFTRFADEGHRTRFEALNAALAERRISPPVRVTGKDGRPPFGVMWRSAKTAGGTPVVFLANLSKSRAEVVLEGRWADVLHDGADLPRTLVLEPMELVLGRAAGR